MASHRVAGRKLSRYRDHRTALLRNLVISLVNHEKVTTTLPKAKETRVVAEKLITYGKKGSLHHRRLALSKVPNPEAVKKVFDELAPRYRERPGGYTRIVKLGPRRGDAAPMAVIELV